MSERSTPDGHDAEGNYDWRNDPLENTPIVRGYQPADILHDLRQMSGIDHVGQTAIRAAEEIERLRARQRATGKRPGAWCCAGCGYPPDECGCDTPAQPVQETTDADEFYAGLYWVWAIPGLGLRVATPKECAAEIIRLRALITPTPPSQDAPHGAQAQRTGCDEGEAPEPADGALWCRSCGTVFTPPLECDCERMGTPELRDAIPYTDDEPGGAL